MNQKNNYSKEQMAKMRKDAINQANRMYQKSKYKNNNYDNKHKNKENNTYQNEKKENNTSNYTNTDFDISKFSIDKILDKMGIDKETALIIVLILLLYKEKSDYKLILALIYLLT